MTLSSLFKSTFILRRPGVAIFANIIKIVIMFIKTICRDSSKVKRVIDFLSNGFIFVSLDLAKFTDFR